MEELRIEENNVDDIGLKVDDLFTKVEKLEQRVNEIEQYYLTATQKQSSGSQKSSFLKDKEKGKHIPGFKKHQQETARREAAAAKRMQEIMRQFGSILRQITQHKWAWPFMQPVDVEGLGLVDYYEVIDRPMDLSTIKNQMEAKDGTEYKHVRDIYSDMKLVFQNALKYNEEKTDVYMMAKTLLDKLEEKWLQFLPRVTEEEKRREEEEAEALLNLQHAQDAALAKKARDISNELYETDMHLEELRETVAQKCRKLSIEDKRNIGIALTQLSPEDLSKALEIVARHNPTFHSAAVEIDLDINAQSESTLWRLKYFVKDALQTHNKTDATIGVSNEPANRHMSPTKVTNTSKTIASKRKKQICNALATTANRKNQIRSS
ncbi:LOW QUALITY PROTEIN: transcription factor GTE6-like [Rutidosis leptorrhynchoides]|uniref:LOW QUALITY PROTEIN: transcription factor GTE6-like n=1 Tax=Rutidosis leptorrhynchoides TaxID=125765 RepID=UPI003A9A1FDE